MQPHWRKSSPGDRQSPNPERNFLHLQRQDCVRQTLDRPRRTLESAATHLTGIDLTPNPLDPLPAPAPAKFPSAAGQPADTAPVAPVGQGAPADHGIAVKNCDLPKLPAPEIDSEGKSSKIARESLVLGAGLGRSFLYGMASLPQRAPEIGASVAIGATLSTISKAGELRRRSYSGSRCIFHQQIYRQCHQRHRSLAQVWRSCFRHLAQQ